MEAYIGIALGVVLGVIPMTWWLRIPLFVLLCLVCVDFCWRSPVTLKYLPKRVRILACLVIFVALVWAGGKNVVTAYQAENLPPRAVRYLQSWGPLDNNVGVVRIPPNVPVLRGRPGGKLVVDTSGLKNYSQKYRLWGACFHWDGREDLLDTTNISHTSFFDITGTNVAMACPWNQQYSDEYIRGYRTTEYYILLVPLKVNKSDFGSLREAVAYGGYILQEQSGEP